MTPELVPLTPGRPAVVERDGVRIYISVHDEAFRRTRAAYKQQLKLAHPDFCAGTRRVVVRAHPRAAHTVHPRSGRDRAGRVRTGQAHPRRAQQIADFSYTIPRKQPGAAFRRIRAAYAAWLRREATWYRCYDLEPPAWGGD